ncbi:hypothetical protein [Gordonia aquimaris]|uniref:Uncharacterized protein n=1 Tax=Gordonia aquimaris TaxID=2984863 RepID=A0A9X3D7N5_9ACTN|nr:hypothetical protein [Gordonia aquimaris]MCX2966242.1 hypothetical protein [Gordonia aquimaris]
MIEGWDAGPDAGWVYVVSVNGNHRLAALAALDVPCVLAEVTPVFGPFDAELDGAQRKRTRRYLRLLHTFGVAASDPAHEWAASTIATEWPSLLTDPDSAVTSLNALERLTGTRADKIGELPREWFDNAATLDLAAEGVERLPELFVQRIEELLDGGPSEQPSPPVRGRWRRGRRT